MSVLFQTFSLAQTAVAYASAYAWERRTVFWRWTTPVLLVYVVWVTRLFGGGTEVLPHAIAGLLAWLIVRLLPGRSTPAAEEPEPPVSPLDLGLRE